MLERIVRNVAIRHGGREHGGKERGLERMHTCSVHLVVIRQCQEHDCYLAQVLTFTHISTGKSAWSHREAFSHSVYGAGQTVLNVNSLGASAKEVPRSVPTDPTPLCRALCHSDARIDRDLDFPNVTRCRDQQFLKTFKNSEVI